jgi:hypothetical protein
MASALIQSNSQSALIATLNSAQGAQTNPFEYTLSKRIPSHGCQWTQLQPVNAGATTPGSVLNFDLIKSAFTRSLTLKFEVKFAALGESVNMVTNPLGFLNLIDHVDIESSSRRILTMTRAAMVAAYSDLGYEQRQAFARGCRMGRSASTSHTTANTASATGDAITIHIPLLFAVFDNPGLALATGFTEPIRISIKFASDYSFVCGYSATADKATSSAGTNSAWPVVNMTSKALSIDTPRLIVEQRLLPNELEDRTISALYSAGPLSQLVYDYEQETDEQRAYTADTEVEIAHEIRSTAVATDIYVWCEVPWTGELANDIPSTSGGSHPGNGTYKHLDASGVPLPIKSIKFQASGQTIVDTVDAEYLGAFSKRTLKDGFFGAAAGGGFELSADKAGDEQHGDIGNPCFVYRLQFGMDNSKQYDSNGISLRELNAPTITCVLPKTTSLNGRKVNAAHSGKTVTMHTVIRKLGLQTTDSSSGRVVSTLSN